MGWFWRASSVGPHSKRVNRPQVQFRVLDSGSWRLVLHQAGPEARYRVRGAESRPYASRRRLVAGPLPSAVGVAQSLGRRLSGKRLCVALLVMGRYAGPCEPGGVFSGPEGGGLVAVELCQVVAHHH